MAASAGGAAHIERLAGGFHYDAGVEWLPDWRQPQRSAAPVPILWRDAAGRACVQYGVNLRKNLEAAYGAAEGGGGMDAEGVAALDALDDVANSPVRTCPPAPVSQSLWLSLPSSLPLPACCAES